MCNTPLQVGQPVSMGLLVAHIVPYTLPTTVQAVSIQYESNVV
jgi:hypothetical protein